MTEISPSEQLKDILNNLGIEQGNTIYLAINMGKVPLPNIAVELNTASIRKREEKWCKFVLDHILNAIGESGTLLVPTFSYSCGMKQLPFKLESTPSEVGPFTEYFRNHDRVVRSLHPIFSVSGLGPNASSILEKTGKSAFGILSPFGRLSRYNTKFLMLGVNLTRSLTYMHHLEHNYGCSHRYHKLFYSDVFRNNVLQTGPWSAYVSYLGIDVELDLSQFELDLKSVNKLKEFSINGSVNQSVSIQDIDLLGYQKLNENSSYFCSRTIEVQINESEIYQNPSIKKIARFKLSHDCNSFPEKDKL